MSAAELIQRAEAEGITFRLLDSEVTLEIPEPLITIWVPRLRTQKAQILAALRQREEGFDRAPRPESQKMDLPWPSYNRGRQFCCEQCGTRFDTSVGYAKHQVYDCDVKPDF